jgi:RNA polymerase sigma-70 factor, ECF subfamily
MTDQNYDSNEMGKPENLSFEQLMVQSSVAGETDPILDDVCTDEEADSFTAEYRQRQAVDDAVLHAAQEVVLAAAQEAVLHVTGRHQAKQLVAAGAAGPTVEQTFASARDAINAVDFARPLIVMPDLRHDDEVITGPQAAVLSIDTTETFARLRAVAFNRLVRESIAGDPDAIADVFIWIRPAIVRYCRARIGRSGPAYSSADDVAQEICLAVLHALARYEDKPGKFLPFVYGIAAHKVAACQRRMNRSGAAPATGAPQDVDVSKTPEQKVMADDLGNRLTALLRTLPTRQREILVLRLIVGLSARETGAAVGITPVAVRVAQHRALTKLRTALSDELT